MKWLFLREVTFLVKYVCICVVALLQLLLSQNNAINCCAGRQIQHSILCKHTGKHSASGAREEVCPHHIPGHLSCKEEAPQVVHEAE